MGSYHSGKHATYDLTSSYHSLDIADLHKHGILTTKRDGVLTWKIQQEGEEIGRSQMCYHVSGSDFTLIFQQQLPDGTRSATQQVSIPLVSTPCNYGGAREWFQAQCCFHKVRILYLAYADNRIQPMCRACLNLQYASKRADRIDQQKRHEQWLLEQGYLWTADEYLKLKKHYLKGEEWDRAYFIGRYNSAMRTLRRARSTMKLFEYMDRQAVKTEDMQKLEVTIIQLDSYMKECKKKIAA